MAAEPDYFHALDRAADLSLFAKSGGSSLIQNTTFAVPGRRVSSSLLPAIVLLALAVHGPLLLMQLPLQSYDTNTHIFFAAHYANHWFDPWNPKWFAGFSQTTYPPLVHQWIALFSHVVGLSLAYMLVQLIAVLLIPIGMYRFARLWVGEGSATYAAIGSIFLGSLVMLVYQSGQLPNTFASSLVLNALPYVYEWLREGRVSAMLKGLFVLLAAGAAHHVTALFGVALFATPIVILAWLDRNDGTEESASTAGILARIVVFGLLVGVGIGITLAPYWMAIHANPIKQAPISHASRDNYLLHPTSGMNFWIVPYGAIIFAIPYIFWKGATNRRLVPLFCFWWLTTMIGLGGTTPVAPFLLGRAFDVLTFERFTYWSTLMALPFVGMLAAMLIERYATKAVVTLSVLAALTCAGPLMWLQYHPITGSVANPDPVISFLNRDQHNRFRYMLLGFGSQFSRVGTYADASSVDGDYNSARLLPEMTLYGSGRLDSAKYFGTNGMESLRAMLKHANQYGLKYIFVHDRYYEPLLAFGGWRPVETYENGSVTLWSKEDIAPARPVESGARPTALEGLLWGTIPVGVSLIALALVIGLPERRRLPEAISFPTPAHEPVAFRGAK
jgi:hypothetical protein